MSIEISTIPGESECQPEPFSPGISDHWFINSLKILGDPIRSIKTRAAYELTGGWAYPELSEHFGDHHLETEGIGFRRLLSELVAPFTAPDGSSYAPLSIDRYREWRRHGTEFERILSGVLRQPQLLDSMVVNNDGTVSLLFSHAEGLTIVRIPETSGSPLGITHRPDVPGTDESGIRRSLVGLPEHDGRLVPVLPGMNAHPLARHAVFSFEGSVFAELRHSGAVSIGEHQALLSRLVSGGIGLNPTTGDIQIDPDLACRWIRLRHLTSPGPENPKAELERFARETVFFRLISETLRNSPSFAENLLDHASFPRLRHRFRDVFLSAYGQSDLDIAIAILANYALLEFEGHASDPSRSPSQRYLASDDSYFRALEEFLLDHPPMLDVRTDGSTSEQEAVIRKLSPGRSPVFPTLDPKDKQAILANVDACFPRLRGELFRHGMDRKAVNFLKPKLNLVEDPADSMKLWRVLIANLGLARVHGEKRFAMSSWFPHTDYYPDGEDLPSIEEIPDSYRPIRDIMDSLIRDGRSAFDENVAAIHAVTPEIASFLQHDPSVPAEIRRFFRDSTDQEQLARLVLSHFGPGYEQDSNIVSRLFPGGFGEFHQMTIRRFVHDFVRGVETELIRNSGSFRERILRQLDGWRSSDLRLVTDTELQHAIDITLLRGAHRIRLLNHDPDERPWTLKDKQEAIERWIGWDTYDMKFLRWYHRHDVYTNLGGAWDCICYARKPLFNTETILQY